MNIPIKTICFSTVIVCCILSVIFGGYGFLLPAVGGVALLVGVETWEYEKYEKHQQEKRQED